MTTAKITQRLVEGLGATGADYFVWDTDLKGFGVRVSKSGAKSYVVRYRQGTGRNAPTARVTLKSGGALTPEKARGLAKKVLGAVAHGEDPALERAEQRRAMTVSDLAEAYLRQHVGVKRAGKTQKGYLTIFENHLKPAIGARRAVEVKRADLGRLHLSMVETPYQANRVLAVASSMFGWATRHGLLPEDHPNPATGIERFKEHAKERFLTSAELEAVGEAIREGETVGLPYEVDESGPKAKHAPKAENRRTKLDPFAAAALRLLLLTGARVSEILTLRWDHVDFERGLLLLPTSKTGKKTIFLNAPALAILAGLPRLGSFVIAGRDGRAKAGDVEEEEKPRSDLKRPWAAVARRAGLAGVRLHDLRHTFASFGAGSSLGLPVIGKLLGHTQAATTQRYAHLDADPLRNAADRIGATIAGAMGEPVGRPTAEVIELPLRKGSGAA